MSRAIPHLRIPVQPGRRGFAVVDQDTDEELVQSVAVILATRPGEVLTSPRFGLEDPTFGGQVDADVVDAVAKFEPRATVDVVAEAVRRSGRVNVTVEIGDAR